MSQPIISCTGLRKEFGRKVAVADLTLDVQPGEIFGFLGPNGAGKTTSVKMLLALVYPTAGSATLLGQPLGDRQARAKIGFLPEHFRFHEWLTAAEFLDLHGQLYGMDKNKRLEAIPRLLKLVGLGDRQQTRLKAFSKGMLQRIGLAQSLLNDPELVFLDEPTSGLDPIGRRLVRDVIKGLRERGTAVFLNSHLLSEVEKTCDRVAFIRDGRILQVTTLESFTQESIQVTLRVGSPSTQLLTGLAQFDEHVSLDGGSRYLLHLPTDEDLPRLANWVIQEGHSLYELKPERLSLEDRFLQIIGEDAGEK